MSSAGGRAQKSDRLVHPSAWTCGSNSKRPLVRGAGKLFMFKMPLIVPDHPRLRDVGVAVSFASSAGAVPPTLPRVKVVGAVAC